MNRIAIIGHFGGDQKFTDGQTVKTINLYNELKKATSEDIQIIDTYYKNKRPVRLFLKTLKTIISTENIFVLVSGNGMNIFFPLLYVAAKMFNVKVIHDVIGGRLGEFIDEKPLFKKYLKSFTMNLVETKQLAEQLVERGISNVEVIPNFRDIKIVDVCDKSYRSDIPYRFCTFSRVTKKKGISEAIKAVQHINQTHEKIVCSLDIYGPVDLEYKSELESLLRQTPDFIRYMGEVSFSESTEVLQNYYGLLFPTYWEGEGAAGTIIESFFAGLPVIATDWNCNKESVITGYNGIIYPSQLALNLEEGIEWLIQQQDRIIEIRKNCLKSAEYYLPDKHIQRILNLIEYCD